MEDEAQKLIVSIGCLAEILTVFYNALHRGGMCEQYALELTAQLLDNMMGGVIYAEDEE